jgi:predicted DNA-binding transcriptional regulator AlpA
MEFEMRPLLTEIEVAKQLCLTTHTLRKWRWLGKGPNFIKIGSSVRYEQEKITSFIEDNIKKSTSELTHG